MDDPHSFFSTISVDELHRLVLAPKGVMEARDVFRALGSPSEIASKFTKNLRVANFDGAFLSFKNSSLVIGLSTELDDARSYLELCGKVFSRIVLRGKVDLLGMTTDRYIHFESLATLISPFLLSAIELEIDLDDFDPQTVDIFTKKFGKSIKDVNIDAIGAPFTLKCFNLPPSLKSFDFKGENLYKLDALWEIVGDNLETIKLDIRDRKGWKSCLGKLKTFCRKLSFIDLKCPLLEAGVEEDDISELLCSYGEKLIYANLTDLKLDSCIQIARQCVNLRCHITFDALLTNSDFSHFPALHNRVQSVLFVPEKTLSSDWAAISSAMKSCGSITEIAIIEPISMMAENRILPVPLGFIQAVFPNPRRLLESLTVYTPLCFRSDSIKHIAGSTGKLKTLQIDCLFPIQSTAFKSICSSNTLLKNIRVRESRPPAGEQPDEEVTYRLLVDLVAATVPCRSLNTLRLLFSGRKTPQEVYLKNIQVPLRTRSVEFSATFDD